jgi:hypothetical protein
LPCKIEIVVGRGFRGLRRLRRLRRLGRLGRFRRLRGLRGLGVNALFHTDYAEPV